MVCRGRAKILEALFIFTMSNKLGLFIISKEKKNSTSRKIIQAQYIATLYSKITSNVKKVDKQIT